MAPKWSSTVKYFLLGLNTKTNVQMTPTSLTFRYKAPQRVVNYKSSTYVSIHLVKQIITYGGSGTARCNSLKKRPISLAFSEEQPQQWSVRWESGCLSFCILGKWWWHAHWTGKNIMNSSVEHVCNPHFVGANAETSEEATNVMQPMRSSVKRLQKQSDGWSVQIVHFRV